ERHGVPGLGWRVGPPGFAGRPPEPVDVRTDGDRLVAGDVAIRFVDQADVGDLYTFCPDPDGPPVALAISATGDGRVEATGEGVRIRARLTRGPGDRFVTIEGVIENRRPDHRLRVHVELPSRAA